MSPQHLLLIPNHLFGQHMDPTVSNTNYKYIGFLNARYNLFDYSLDPCTTNLSRLKNDHTVSTVYTSFHDLQLCVERYYLNILRKQTPAISLIQSNCKKYEFNN